jgi:hypothetical protein
MQMSDACTAPTQPASTAEDCAHPRYREYQAYRNAMSIQLVTGASFKSWLRQTEERENGSECVFEVTSKRAPLARGWYKHVFGPGNILEHRFGPFSERHDAECA